MLEEVRRIDILKIDKKLQNTRLNGAAWIINYAEDHGLEEAKKELGRRGATYIPFEVPSNAVEKFCGDVKCEMLDCVLVLASSILVDKFEFDSDKLAEFIDMFNERADCIGEDYVTWFDILNQIEEDTGIHMEMKFLEGKNNV